MYSSTLVIGFIVNMLFIICGLIARIRGIKSGSIAMIMSAGLIIDVFLRMNITFEEQMIMTPLTPIVFYFYILGMVSQNIWGKMPLDKIDWVGDDNEKPIPKYAIFLLVALTGVVFILTAMNGIFVLSALSCSIAFFLGKWDAGYQKFLKDKKKYGNYYKYPIFVQPFHEIFND